MAGARAYECVYCHDLDRSHAINDETKKKGGGEGVTRVEGFVRDDAVEKAPDGSVQSSADGR